MAGGLGAAGFGAGFGEGLTSILLQHRRDKAAKSERELQMLAPVYLQMGAETGDYSGYENLISQFDPDLAKTLRKNSPFAKLHQFIGPQVKMSAQQPAMSNGAQPQTGLGGLPLPSDEPAPPGQPQPQALLPSRTVNTEPIPGTSAPTGPTFFGSPVSTPEQRGVSEIDTKLAMARRLVATGASPNIGDALDRLGLRETTSGASTLRYGGIRSADDIPKGTLDVSGQPITQGSGKLYRVQLGPNGKEIFEPTINQGASLGADASRIAVELGYGDIRNVKDPRQMALINATLQQRQGQLKVSDAIRFANTMLPNTDVNTQLALADALMAGTTQAGVAAIAGATGAPTAGATAPTTPAQAAPTTPTTPTTPAPKIGAAVPKAIGGATKTAGKEPPPQIAQTLARTKSTNMLIDQALAALEPYKNDGRLETTIALTKNYRTGVGSKIGDIATNADEISQIADLAGLLQAADLRRSGSRAYQFQTDIKQHVPRLPSSRQIMFATKTPLSAGAVSDASMGLGGQSWDSPQIMYEKLQRLKAANLDFVSTLESELKGGGEAGAVGAAGTPTSPAAMPQIVLDPTTKRWNVVIP